MGRAKPAYEGAGCPRCWTPLPRAVLDGGAAYCGSCALSFTAAIFEPPERPQAVVRAVDLSTSDSRCARHARNVAVAACERCGAFMCALCRIDSDGKVLCSGCFERLRGEGELASASTSFRSWRTMGTHLALLGLLLSPLGVVIGPATVVAAVRGLRQDRKSGEGGGLTATLSIVAGVLVTLFGVVMLFALTGAFARKK